MHFTFYGAFVILLLFFFSVLIENAFLPLFLYNDIAYFALFMFSYWTEAAASAVAVAAAGNLNVAQTYQENRKENELENIVVNATRGK